MVKGKGEGEGEDEVQAIDEPIIRGAEIKYTRGPRHG